MQCGSRTRTFPPALHHSPFIRVRFLSVQSTLNVMYVREQSVSFPKRSLYQTILFNSRSGQTCRSHPRVPFLTHSISSLRNVSRLCFLPHPLLLLPQIRPPSFLLTDVPTAILVPYSSVVCTAASTVLLIAWQFMSCLCSAPPLVCHRTQNSQHPHILP